MYIDRNILDEYPFDGEFYTERDTMPEDGDMLGDEPDDGDFLGEDTNDGAPGFDTVLPGADSDGSDNEDLTDVVCSVKCDIQETNKAFVSGALTSYLDVYFEFDKTAPLRVRMGQRFRSSNWYRPVDGMVFGVVPTQMGGCVAHIKEVGVDYGEKG